MTHTCGAYQHIKVHASLQGPSAPTHKDLLHISKAPHRSPGPSLPTTNPPYYISFLPVCSLVSIPVLFFPLSQTALPMPSLLHCPCPVCRPCSVSWFLSALGSSRRFWPCSRSYLQHNLPTPWICQVVNFYIWCPNPRMYLVPNT